MMLLVNREITSFTKSFVEIGKGNKCAYYYCFFYINSLGSNK